MKFERVDDKTVKCFLSNEELEEYDIEYQDFLTQSDKAKQLIQEVVQQAAAQVGYKPPKFAFEMQIMVMPEQGMLLTLRDGDSPQMHPLQQLMMYLQGLKAALGQMQNAPGAPQGGNAVPQQADGAPTQAPKHPVQAVFAFESLHNLMTYAAGLPTNLRVESRLYGMRDFYFLYLARGKASGERFAKTCAQALEFSQICGTDDMQLKLLEEHADCLIAEKALRKLQGVSKVWVQK